MLNFRSLFFFSFLTADVKERINAKKKCVFKMNDNTSEQSFKVCYRVTGLGHRSKYINYLKSHEIYHIDLIFLRFRVMYYTEKRKGGGYMLKKEVEYRLCRLLLANLQGDGLLTENEVMAINQMLLDKIKPLFRTAENLDSKIGDGVKVHG